MKILAIDTATEACSAALYVETSDTGPVNHNITSTYQLAPREHSRLILKMVDELLVAAGINISEIDAIAFGRGPGSFMGIRIAAGVVQGIAFAHDIPVIPLSTLKVIALRAAEETQSEHVLVAIDARMDEVYWAAYYRKDEQWLLDGEEQVISPDKLHLGEILFDKDASWVGAGTGWGSYADRLLSDATTGSCPDDQTDDRSGKNFNLQQMLPDYFPSAEVMVKMAVEEFKAGNVVTAAEAIPVYLRNDVAKKPKPVVL